MPEILAGVDPVFLIIVCAVTFVASTAATVAGFGLGVTLTPIFAFVYPAQLAVLLVAVVHFLNNSLRLAVFIKHVDRQIALRFGLLCVVFAFFGAYLQGMLPSDWLKVVMGGFLIFISGIYFATAGKPWTFPKGFEVFGGIVAGVMGGLVGAQGGIVAAFLVNLNLVKEAFVATSTLITWSIDLMRVPVYLWTESTRIIKNLPLLITVTVFGWAGTFLGKRLVIGISPTTFKKVVNTLVVALGLLTLLQGANAAASLTVGVAVAVLEFALLVAVRLIVLR